MAEQRLGRFGPAFSARPEPSRVSKLIRVPVREAVGLAGSGDRLRVAVGRVLLARDLLRPRLLAVDLARLNSRHSGGPLRRKDFLTLPTRVEEVVVHRDAGGELGDELLALRTDPDGTRMTPPGVLVFLGA